jgi:5'(3')-deoxyribonucleotidase
MKLFSLHFILINLLNVFLLKNLMAQRQDLFGKEIIDKIMLKKEFGDLPREDVKLVYSQFDKKDLLVEEKIKRTRDLLRKMYTAFVSKKLLNIKDKSSEWFLKKHISTKERLESYEEVYKKCLEGLNKNCSVVDFGCGINGFSYSYFKKIGFNVQYIGIESVGQLVDLQNNYFKKNKIFNAKCVKSSLFKLDEIKKIVESVKGKRVGFFFKVLDSLEMLEKDYSKKVLKELVPMFDRCVVSWATKSLISKKRFYAERKWLKDFINKEFFIIDEFEISGENYLVFSKK